MGHSPADPPQVIRALLPLTLLAACAAAPSAPEPMLGLSEVTPDAEGRCWVTDTQQAVIGTAQEDATPMVRAEDGTDRAPATYRGVVRQGIAREQAIVASETLCPPAYTPDFVASLQRALAGHGHYQGPVDGPLGPALDWAIQDVGPDSPLLSLAAVRDLSLVALSQEEIARL